MDMAKRILKNLWRFMRAVMVVMVLAVTGCASQRESHEHTTHIIKADTLATEARHDGHTQATQLNIDSIVTASVWAAMQEFQSMQQEHERTTETLTETIDSLGRIVRQQQKTTDRTISKQEKQRYEQLLQESAVNMRKELYLKDSTWAALLAHRESHLIDSLNQEHSRKSAVSGAPVMTFWEKMRSWLFGGSVGIGFTIITGLMLQRKKKQG